MQFSKQLKEEMNRHWEGGIKATTLWKALDDGTYTAKNYAAFLTETFHYTRRSALIQASAIPHFQLRNRELALPFLKHAAEEEGHYKLAKHDLSLLGFDTSTLDCSDPLPLTEGYIGFIFNRITFVNPISYLGYLFQLEAMAATIGAEAAGKIVKSIPNAARAMAFLRVHAHEDQEHVSELSALIDRFVQTDIDAREVAYSAKTSASLYVLMMEYAFQKSQD